MREVRSTLTAMRRISLVLAFAASACGGGQSGSGAASPEPAAEPAEASTPSAEVSSSDASPSESPTDGAEPAAPAAPPPSPVALCNAMCERVGTRCTKNAAAACRTNCEQYEHPPAGCEAEVRMALECASKAEDLSCVVIAPKSCASEFRRVVACSTGKEAPGTEAVAEARLPDGWERFESKGQGFAGMMPRGVTEKRDAKEPTYATTQGGAEYAVRILPPPKEKPTQKNLVPLASKLLGNCARKLKLFGLIERPDRVSIRYASRCADGAEWRGSFVITGSKMYVLQITAPAGVKVEADAFVYGFELL